MKDQQKEYFREDSKKYHKNDLNTKVHSIDIRLSILNEIVNMYG